MARCSALILIFIFLLGVLPAWNAPRALPGDGANFCAIPLTQVVEIPISRQGAPGTATSPGGDAPTLTISPGATDELPEGPDSFDVLDDGSLLITDPLRSRIVVFDPQGKFRKAWKIGFAADSVTVIPNGMIVVQEAGTGQLHLFDRDGQPHPKEVAALPGRAEARVLTGASGTIARTAFHKSPRDPLAIQFDRSGRILLSIEGLADDREGNTYVALESTAASGSTEDVNVSKDVRKYTADGALVREIADIPLDYYVSPVDELRVNKGMVYQLLTTKTGVKINEWNTNQLCSRP